MIYLDTNFIAALHFNIAGQSGTAEKFIRKVSLPLVVSGLAELEARRAFRLRTGESRSENWLHFQARLDQGLWVRFPVPWERAAGQTARLIDRHGALRFGTLDALHVALARLAGCAWFLSFDTNSNARVLAAVDRLKVFPGLSPAEKAILGRL